MRRLRSMAVLAALAVGFLASALMAEWRRPAPSSRPYATASPVVQNAQFLVQELQKLAHDNQVMAQTLDRRAERRTPAQEESR